MPASTGIVGLGTKLQVQNSDSPPTYDDVANVVSMDVGLIREIVDATHLGSPNSYREKKPHLKDAGPFTATVQFDPTHATHDDATGTWALFDDGTLGNFALDFSGADGGASPWATNNLFTFAGYVTGLGFGVAVDNLIEQQLEITITGPITIGNAS